MDNLLDRFEEIWMTISRNKIRSLITAFGVFWGIFMLTLMIGTGNGIQRGFERGIDGFAGNSCFIGSLPTSIPYQGFQRGREWSIQNQDLRVLTDAIPEIDFLSPMVVVPMYLNNVTSTDRTGTFPVRGVYPNYANIERQNLTGGRFINDFDILQRRTVAVIGTRVAEELFPNNNTPIGENIRIGGVNYQVIGITYGLSDITVGGSRLEDAVILPLTTLQQLNNLGDVIHILAATAQSHIPVSFVEERIKEELRMLHNIHPSDTRALWSVNLEEEFNVFTNLFLGISILIWIIGSGTLIAGVMGISNIMLVTVKERTREIGIRRALGATPRTIISQILSESMILSLFAGIPGLCAGVYVLLLADKHWIQHLDNVFFYRPMITLDVAILYIVILVVCGTLAGAFPANRALRIKAIDAIREE